MSDEYRFHCDERGLVGIDRFEIPLSPYLSDEARKAFIDARNNPQLFDFSSVDGLRGSLDRLFWSPLLARARSRYSVEIEGVVVNGIPVAVVRPAVGVPAENKRRVLINLHGGSFEVGAGLGGLVEAVPIAAIAEIEVITVDYRQGPEFKYPAATEDVTKVYKHLLERYEAASIGIYGCSAGAILTSQVVASLPGNGLPAPGAIALLSAGGDPRYAGDSRHLSCRLSGDAPVPESWEAGLQLMRGYSTYLRDIEPADPLVYPALSPSALEKFPPTMLTSGTRSYDLSAVVFTHCQLVNAGVETALHVWEGMWHGFHYDVAMPEARDACAAVARFFRRHLK